MGMLKMILSRRAAFAALAAVWLFAAGVSHAQRSRNLSEVVHPLTPEDAAERWAEFAASRPADGYCFDFEIEHMPRRGESTFHSGSIWGRHISSDTFLQRIEINSKDPAKSAAAYLILSRGGAARVYAFDGSSVSEIPPEKWREPLLNGLIYSPFDLLAPYKGWPAAYAGPGRIVKAVHFFDLVPGAEDAAANPGLKKVRVALSREFNAPFQTEFFGPSGVERVLSLDSVKKVEGNWIARRIEMSDKVSRDKDRISITAAKFTDAIPSETFSPETLGARAARPELESL